MHTNCLSGANRLARTVSDTALFQHGADDAASAARADFDALGIDKKNIKIDSESTCRQGQP